LVYQENDADSIESSIGSKIDDINFLSFAEEQPMSSILMAIYSPMAVQPFGGRWPFSVP
jgi:hypothetical protein